MPWHLALALLGRLQAVLSWTLRWLPVTASETSSKWDVRMAELPPYIYSNYIIL